MGLVRLRSDSHGRRKVSHLKPAEDLRKPLFSLKEMLGEMCPTYRDILYALNKHDTAGPWCFVSENYSTHGK